VSYLAEAAAQARLSGATYLRLMLGLTGCQAVPTSTLIRSYPGGSIPLALWPYACYILSNESSTMNHSTITCFENSTGTI